MRSMFALAFALAAAGPLPAGTVIAGVSSPNSPRTEVMALFPDGTQRPLFTEEHAPGFVPKGALNTAATRVVLAVQKDGAEGASVVVWDFASGARTLVGERAVRTQAPSIFGDVVTWVRAAESPLRSTFDVVSARMDGGGEEVRASIEGAWLTPIAGFAQARYLHLTSDGDNRIVALEGTALEVIRVLGKGRYRIPALAGPTRSLVERGLPGGRAEVIDERGALVRTGLAGMQPLAVSTARSGRSPDGVAFVMGAGGKHAALVAIEETREGTRERSLDLGRPGIATPLAATLVNGALTVVARLDRGRALPAELVLLDGRGARVLVTGGSVEVYGVVGDLQDEAANEGAR